MKIKFTKKALLAEAKKIIRSYKRAGLRVPTKRQALKAAQEVLTVKQAEKDKKVEIKALLKDWKSAKRAVLESAMSWEADTGTSIERVKQTLDGIYDPPSDEPEVFISGGNSEWEDAHDEIRDAIDDLKALARSIEVVVMARDEEDRLRIELAAVGAIDENEDY